MRLAICAWCIGLGTFRLGKREHRCPICNGVGVVTIRGKR